VLHRDAAKDAHVDWLQQVHAQDMAGHSGMRHSYDIGALKGYSGTFSPDLLERIRSRPDVAYVERDSVVWASDVEKGAPWVGRPAER
jgi:cerevisin